MASNQSFSSAGISTKTFTIESCIGRGNFGDVYKATDIRTSKQVAIKVVNLEHTDEDIDTLAQEIFFLSELKSPYVTQYLGTLVEDVSMWIVMEYCGGGSCAELLRLCYRQGLPEQKVSFIVKNVLLGLEYLHSQQKIHRDIKADNILLTEAGEVKLGDFGVSGQMRATMKRGTYVGTPHWMAPEIVNAEANDGYDSKADIWSLGITTYELLKGLPPLSKYEPLKVLAGLGKRKAPRLHGHFHACTKEFVAQCLIKCPSRRPSVTELLEKSEFIILCDGGSGDSGRDGNGTTPVTNLRADVELCNEIRSHNGLPNRRKKPRFSISERFYNTGRNVDCLEWDFTSMRCVKYIKEASVRGREIDGNEYEEPSQESRARPPRLHSSPASCSSSSSFSPNSCNSSGSRRSTSLSLPLTDQKVAAGSRGIGEKFDNDNNISDDDSDNNDVCDDYNDNDDLPGKIFETKTGFNKFQTVTPLTAISESGKRSKEPLGETSQNILNRNKLGHNGGNRCSANGKQQRRYDVSSNMDIDQDAHRAQPEISFSNLDYFKNVIQYSLRRMAERANDEETRNYVNLLMFNYELVERQVPGFSDVFMEEVLWRMETIKNYLLGRSI